MWTVKFTPAKPGSTYGNARALFDDGQGFTCSCSYNFDSGNPSQVSSFMSDCKKTLQAEQSRAAAESSVAAALEAELNK